MKAPRSAIIRNPFALQAAKGAGVSTYAWLLLAQLAQGSGGIFGRFALQGMGPLTAMAWRMGFAAVPLLMYGMWQKRARISMRDEWKILLAGFVLGLHFAGWAASLLRLSVAELSVLVCTPPLWTALYETLFQGRRFPKILWIVMLLSVASVGVIAGYSGEGNVPRSGEGGLGVAMALTSSLALATYFTLVRGVAVSAHGTAASNVQIITRTYAYAALLLCAASSIFEAHVLPSTLPGWQVWLGVTGMAILPQSVGHTLQSRALRSLSASTVGMATLLEPLFAALLAAFVFAEHVSRPALFSGIFLMGMLCWALRLLAKAPPTDGPTS